MGELVPMNTAPCLDRRSGLHSLRASAAPFPVSETREQKVAITLPYSVELGLHEDAVDAVEADGSGVVTPTASKMKVFLNSGVDPKKIQSAVGSLRAIYRHMMNEHLRAPVGSAALIGYGDGTAATASYYLDIETKVNKRPCMLRVRSISLAVYSNYAILSSNPVTPIVVIRD